MWLSLKTKKTKKGKHGTDLNFMFYRGVYPSTTIEINLKIRIKTKNFYIQKIGFNDLIPSRDIDI